mmetsp:Transcript_8001/g.9639  ORF Transcript_8001/g.9639 Transcript_8001/m.9639 type:complete len:242 (+) Transcript_8001:41-766(+)
MNELVVFNAQQSFSQEAKALRERVFSFLGQTIKIEQAWRDDHRGGTEIGFGACVYESSYVLSDYLCSHPEIIKNKKVLELGSGLGLVSIVCSKIGASLVLATDGDPASVELTRQNLQNNGCLNSSAKMFLWEDETERERMKAYGFDVIVASDIVACPYVDAFESLLSTLNSLLTQSDKEEIGKLPTFILCYKPRGKCEESFFQRMRGLGFSLTSKPPKELHKDYRSSDIKIIEIRMAENPK